MNIFGFHISRTKTLVPQTQTLSGLDSRGAWWPLIRESVAGAWQQNIEVQIENVLQYAPVYACVRLISSDIGKLRMRLVEQDAAGIWHETERPAFSPVLRKPNRFQTRIKFFQYWITSKLIHGNAYILKQRDQRGIVVALYVLDPTVVRPMVAPDGDVFYELQADNLAGLTQAVLVPASEIIHDVHVQLYHPLVGVSPLTACGIAAVEALRIEEASTVFFGNGSKPGGVLTAPGPISQETADRMKAAWDTNFGGANSGKVAVLGDGLKYEQMAVNATDAQLIEQLRWTAEDVCQAFGVPPYKINVGPPPNYSNIQALDIQYYGQCLQELMENVEELLDLGLGLAPNKIDGVRLGTEFNRDDLLQMDTAGKVTAAASAITSGLSPDEVRFRFFDLGPVEGGRNVYMQNQNWPLAQLGQREIAQAPPMPDPLPSAADTQADPQMDVAASIGPMLIKEVADVRLRRAA